MSWEDKGDVFTHTFAVHLASPSCLQLFPPKHRYVSEPPHLHPGDNAEYFCATFLLIARRKSVARRNKVVVLYTPSRSFIVYSPAAVL